MSNHEPGETLVCIHKETLPKTHGGKEKLQMWDKPSQN